MSSHRIDGRKLSRKRGPRLALYKNLIVSVLRYERIQTTEAKGKEVRGQVERMITLAKRGDLAARRTVVVGAPERAARHRPSCSTSSPPSTPTAQSGFTRIVHIGQRKGDAAEIVQIELV